MREIFFVTPAHLFGVRSRRDYFAGAIQHFGDQCEIAAARRIVANCGLDFQISGGAISAGRVMPDLAGDIGGNECAPRRHLERIGDDQPHVAIDPAALVPPALEPARIGKHGQSVLLAEPHRGSDVHAKCRVPARVLLDELAVHEDDRVAIYASEFHPDALSLARRRKRNLLLVPGGIERQIAMAAVS